MKAAAFNPALATRGNFLSTKEVTTSNSKS